MCGLLWIGGRWSLIAANIPGRTDNEIKNYWNSHLSRRIYTFRRNPYASSPTTTATAAATAPPPLPLLLKPKTCTSNYSTGRTSRAAMRKQRAALTFLRKKERQHLLAQRNQDPVVPSKALISFSTQISEGSGSGPGSTTASSDRNGTPDLELGSSRDKFNAAEDGGDADVCCCGGDGGGGREDESLGPYEWLDGEIMRLEYVLQEGENSTDSLRQEDIDVIAGGGGNNGGGRRPIHGGEIMIESDWADIRSSPSTRSGPGPCPGPRMGDEALDFVFDWDWPAGGDGDRHHHHPSQWEWDLLWGGDDGIGSLSPLNCDEN